MSFFGLFGGGSDSGSIEEFLKEGAVVIDVRTPLEFSDGHVKGSKNIVLNNIPSAVDEIKGLNKKVIAVCRSGARSGQATSFLKKNGIDVINGGPWQNVAKFVN
ncbi:MAG: rhodanese-like domain-containing protein [Lutibacter sp.]|uniref:rhodanese-like domain-containing protein n=1 Tax=Lutibacter sp. TaxID=1925666 RepID=UPI0018009336|nr:rhodanese-like domain-containing protein [Lutibacter sp.]MBT8316691.1 rhodanese-like domain-containing protein [Lutibacter sp.]NNJ57551.1 rhodanese-like domain-containing protein [Lutibacter sp.]